MTDKGANSLERVLALLDVFSEDKLEWTSEELISALGYSRPTLYRYLKTLKEAGWLAPTNAGFALGPKVVEMDYLLRKSDPVLLKGTPHLEALSAQYICTSLLVRWYRNHLLCIDSRCSQKNPISSYPRGRPMPLARGAIGRSILAFLPRRHQIPLVRSKLAELKEVGVGSSEEDVYESLKRVRKKGYAVAFGEVTPGAIGLAAPLFAAGDTPVGAIGLTIAGADYNSVDLERMGESLVAAAAALSGEMGTEVDL